MHKTKNTNKSFITFVTCERILKTKFKLDKFQRSYLYKNIMKRWGKSELRDFCQFVIDKRNEDFYLSFYGEDGIVDAEYVLVMEYNRVIHDRIEKYREENGFVSIYSNFELPTPKPKNILFQILNRLGLCKEYCL